MKAIITNQPSTEVTQIEGLGEITTFYLANGEKLRVGVALDKLQALLNLWEGVPGIDLSQPPSTQREIFYSPFMARSVYGVTWPIIGTHPKIQKSFRGHPNLQAVARLDYERLSQLPLEAYVSGPFGLYLNHPFNFINRSADPTVVDGANEYVCNFRDGSYLVRVFVNLRTLAVAIAH